MKTDRVWGIDRYESSLTRGELVAPVIFLWKKPNKKTTAANLGGALNHGAEVSVLEEKIIDGRSFVLVETEVLGRLQRGWTRATLLKDRGIEEEGILD